MVLCGALAFVKPLEEGSAGEEMWIKLCRWCLSSTPSYNQRSSLHCASPPPCSPALYPVISFKYGFSRWQWPSLTSSSACLTFNNNNNGLGFYFLKMYAVSELHILYISLWLLVFYRNHSSWWWHIYIFLWLFCKLSAVWTLQSFLELL